MEEKGGHSVLFPKYVSVFWMSLEFCALVNCGGAEFCGDIPILRTLHRYV